MALFKRTYPSRKRCTRIITHTSHTAIFPYVTLIALFIHKSTGNYMTYTPQTHLFLTGFYRSHQSVVISRSLTGFFLTAKSRAASIKLSAAPQASVVEPDLPPSGGETGFTYPTVPFNIGKFAKMMGSKINVDWKVKGYI